MEDFILHPFSLIANAYLILNKLYSILFFLICTQENLISELKLDQMIPEQDLCVFIQEQIT
jgi:hypothetical protein